MASLTYAEALRQALYSEMKKDPRVILLGEDIGVLGNVFGVTKGFLDEFGCKRVRSTPISEAAITGAAVGAAMLGLRPVAEIMYVDFTTMAMDQIINQAAKMRYMTGGKVKVPMVLRTQGGAGSGEAAQHCQSLEAFFVHVPGLKVVMPSSPYDAKGLLLSAIRDENPVIFIEHKLLYGLKEEVPEEEYTIPLGKAVVKKEGKDLTIVATSFMVQKVLKALPFLEKEGIYPEVIDPRTLVPLDKETIYQSIQKTHFLLIVQEAASPCSFAAELAALVAEDMFDYLDAPLKRLCGLSTPIPYNKKLEDASIPNEENIITAVREILKG
ncbi:MAG: alpha-ketoacid dehydrogenase subunit beta [Candidatus Atribacteria bacterium]|nr:alpha-ketoacid dehydrogenase subunit beta [Candidatus Atribacteria bacterium]